jgi:hypothetical protein
MQPVIVVLLLGRSAGSFDYNKDVKVSSETSDKDIMGKTVKRWRKELKRSGKKNGAGFHIGDGFISGIFRIFSPPRPPRRSRLRNLHL